MRRRLFWKLSVFIVSGTVGLFVLLHWLMLQTEQQMSFIDTQHQQTLMEYAQKAEALYLQGDHEALRLWIQQIQETENTWVAVVKSSLMPLAGSTLIPRFLDSFTLGRDISWKIHLYFKENPIMDLTFADGHTHFLILLPQRMRPGAYWPYTSLLLQIGLPMLLMILMSLLIYRHVMAPLRQLQVATRQFSEGNFEVRVQPQIANRHDEISALAVTFDDMADRIGSLIDYQRHLTSDLSHELRTPLTRIELALSMIKQPDLPNYHQIQADCAVMRHLVEDTLMLAWLQREQPSLRTQHFDLSDLLDSIADNIRFEFSEKRLKLSMPEQAPIQLSNAQALGHAIENILRNAMKYSPADKPVELTLLAQAQHYLLEIVDHGPGVPDEHLTAIFQPFFRVTERQQTVYRGFGIGLSLAKRQVNAVGGTITAQNNPVHGLSIKITLPVGISA